MEHAACISQKSSDQFGSTNSILRYKLSETCKCIMHSLARRDSRQRVCRLVQHCNLNQNRCRVMKEILPCQVGAFADLAVRLAGNNRMSWDSKPYIKCVRKYIGRRDNSIRPIAQSGWDLSLLGFETQQAGHNAAPGPGQGCASGCWGSSRSALYSTVPGAELIQVSLQRFTGLVSGFSNPYKRQAAQGGLLSCSVLRHLIFLRMPQLPKGVGMPDVNLHVAGMLLVAPPRLTGSRR